MVDVKKNIEDAKSILNALKQELIDVIGEQPDNPRIKRLEGGAFTMNVSDCFTKKGSNLSPYYHDFDYQYSELIKIVTKTDSERLIPVFEEIINTGFHNAKSKDRIQFHPDVIEKIKAFTGL